MKVEVIVKIDGVEVSRQETDYKELDDKTIYRASDYARIFDESCPAWTRDPEANKMFLRQMEVYLTGKLQRVGHLFLNEAYDMLGFTRTKIGAMVGWIYDEENPEGDNYVSFGIFTEDNKRFVNGYENSILLDFNVDGNILDKF